VLDELWGVDKYFDRIIGARQPLIDGNLRSLPVAWMFACQCDEVDPDHQTNCQY